VGGRRSGVAQGIVTITASVTYGDMASPEKSRGGGAGPILVQSGERGGRRNALLLA